MTISVMPAGMLVLECMWNNNDIGISVMPLVALVVKCYIKIYKKYIPATRVHRFYIFSDIYVCDVRIILIYLELSPLNSWAKISRNRDCG